MPQDYCSGKIEAGELKLHRDRRFADFKVNVAVPSTPGDVVDIE